MVQKIPSPVLNYPFNALFQQKVNSELTSQEKKKRQTHTLL